MNCMYSIFREKLIKALLCEGDRRKGSATCLDPREKHSDGYEAVELPLPVADVVEVCILIWIVQKWFQEIANDHRAIKVEQDSDVTQEKNNHIQDVPQALEVLQLVLLDLDDLFDGVVNEEEHEDSLASHDKVVETGHVTDEFQGLEIESRDTPTGGWVLKQQSEIINDSNVKTPKRWSKGIFVRNGSAGKISLHCLNFKFFCALQGIPYSTQYIYIYIYIGLQTFILKGFDMNYLLHCL